VSRQRKPAKNRSDEPPEADPLSDVEAFARAMSDVVPLPPDRQQRVHKPGPVPTMRSAPLPAVRSVGEPEAPAGSRRDDFATAGVDRREIRKLKRGTYTVQGHLDLHGQTLAEAFRSVHQFIEQSRHARHRCVCIVHGRGLNSPGGVSVLREPVRERLTRLPSVLAFADAPHGDGGAGAVYVLLRK
jgi:DNA-nicking Smr family endonuclease